MHIQAVHNTVEKTFKCDSCEKMFSSKANLDRHAILHNKKTIVCNSCDTKFSGISELNNHIKLKHEQQEKLKCDLCDKIFQKYKIEAHIQAVHENNSIKCNICEKNFTDKKNLRHHLNSIHLK